MASSPARLIVRHGPNPSQEYSLVLNTNIVGREPINDVVLPDPEISRRHARIVLQANSYYIEDLGSTNGTFINGRRIHAITKLGNGDIIDFGESIRVTFVREDEETGPMAPPANNPPTTAVNPRITPSTQPQTADLEQAAVPQPPAYENHQQTRRNMYIGIAFVAVLLLVCSCVVIFYALDAYAPDLLYSIIPGSG